MRQRGETQRATGWTGDTHYKEQLKEMTLRNGSLHFQVTDTNEVEWAKTARIRWCDSAKNHVYKDRGALRWKTGKRENRLCFLLQLNVKLHVDTWRFHAWSMTDNCWEDLENLGKRSPIGAKGLHIPTYINSISAVSFGGVHSWALGRRSRASTCCEDRNAASSAEVLCPHMCSPEGRRTICKTLMTS